MKDTILCIDIGTTSLKAALMPETKESVFVSRQKFATGHAEEWIPAVKKAFAELNERNPDTKIRGVCISGNGPTLVVEKTDRSKGARPQGQCESFQENPYDDCAPLSLTLLHNEPVPQSASSCGTKSIFIPRLKAFKEMFPLEWTEAEHVFSGPEYLVYRLTEKAFTVLPEERFAAAYWNRQELLQNGFTDEDIVKLPPFECAPAFAGNITKEAFLATGIPEGVKVFCGGPDFAVALIGTGTVIPGRLCDRAGSTEGINLCTKKPVFAEGLRTLPSPSRGLWNVSRLLLSGEDFSKAVEMLRRAAKKNGIVFPSEMTITGGQALDDDRIRQKEKDSGLKIKKQFCNDAELIGDLVLALTGLGDYDDIAQACQKMKL